MMDIPFSAETTVQLREMVESITSDSVYRISSGKDTSVVDGIQKTYTYASADIYDGPKPERSNAGQISPYKDMLRNIFNIEDPALNVAELGVYSSTEWCSENEDGSPEYTMNHTFSIAFEREGLLNTSTFFLEVIDSIALRSNIDRIIRDADSGNAHLVSEFGDVTASNDVLGNYRPVFEGGEARDAVWQQRLKALVDILRPTFELG